MLIILSYYDGGANILPGKRQEITIKLLNEINLTFINF
jgi:hypothetical protein